MTIDDLSDKQLEILLLIYRYRFLSRNQIQQFLNHKDYSLINRYLKFLTDCQLINRIYSTKRTDINTPAVYFLATKSKSLLKDYDKCNSDVLGRVYREKYRSEAFRSHCLFLANLYFHFQTAAKKQKSVCHFYTATDISDVAYTPLPLPDAYITIKEGKKHIKRYFLDIFNDDMPMFAVRRRIQEYCRYFNGNYWQDHNKDPFPKVFLICPTRRVQKSLLKSIPQILETEDTDISFFLGLQSDIQQRGVRNDSWEAA
jgi:hypothetical protein